MTDRSRAIDQLARAIDCRLGRLEMYGLAARIRDVRAYAATVVADLCSDDERLSAEAAQTVTEWGPWAEPAEYAIPSAWWATDLGGLTLSAMSSGEMSVPDAIAALGLSRARIYQLLDEGLLQRGPAGGITRHSVARRLDDSA